MSSEEKCIQAKNKTNEVASCLEFSKRSNRCCRLFITAESQTRGTRKPYPSNIIYHKNHIDTSVDSNRNRRNVSKD